LKNLTFKYIFEKVVKEKRGLKKSTLNSYDIGKLILQCMRILMKHRLQIGP